MKKNIHSGCLLSLAILIAMTFSGVSHADTGTLPPTLLRDSTALVGKAKLAQLYRTVVPADGDPNEWSMQRVLGVQMIDPVGEHDSQATVYIAVDLPQSNQLTAQLMISTHDMAETGKDRLVERLGTLGLAPVHESGWVACEISSASNRPPVTVTAASESQQRLWELAMETPVDATAQVAIVLPDYVKETVAELQPSLPDFLGGTAAHPMLSQLHVISLVHRAAAVPWTSPQDYPFDDADPAALMQPRAGRFTIAMLDGSVQNLSAKLPPRVWLALFTRNGGEMVGREIDAD